MTRKANRKKTNSVIPAKGRMRDIADQLWALAIKDDWNNICAMCGVGDSLNSHHLIPRQNYAVRYDLLNGCCLCCRCHMFCPNRAPHLNAAGFLEWLKDKHPDRHAWYVGNPRPLFTGTTNTIYYCDLICGFREYFEPEEFERLVGIRFNRYLLEDYVT